MIDRWYYTHAGQTLGPVTAAQLRQLAAGGKLAPSDLIWPEGRQQSEGVPAQAAIEFAAPATPLANKPDWLDDIRTAGAAEKTPAPPVKPDWLDDVRTAEEENQAPPASLEWDGDNLSAEEKAFMLLLEKREEVAHPKPKTTPSPPPAPRSCRLVLGSATSRGRVRDRNEDSLLIQQSTWSNRDRSHDVALLVVADGMGGHAAGERASGLVVRALSGVLAPLVTAALNEPPAVSPDLAQVLERGLQEANHVVRQAAQGNAACKGMGSTAAAVLIWDGRAFISLVGDCRVYHWRAGTLTQVTRDQTLVARMVELGQLTPEEAATHPRRNEVAQAVGKYALIEPDRYELTLNAGDWLVASSDGLQAHVNDHTLGETIAKAGAAAAELANRLVELANQGGGSDNCTVIAVRCQ